VIVIKATITMVFLGNRQACNATARIKKDRFMRWYLTSVMRELCIKHEFRQWEKMREMMRMNLMHELILNTFSQEKNWTDFHRIVLGSVDFTEFKKLWEFEKVWERKVCEIRKFTRFLIIAKSCRVQSSTILTSVSRNHFDRTKHSTTIVASIKGKKLI